MAFITTVAHLPIIRQKSVRGNPPSPPVDPVVPPWTNPEVETCGNYTWYHTIAGIQHMHYVTSCHTASRAASNLVEGQGSTARTRRITRRESTGARNASVQEMGRMVS